MIHRKPAFTLIEVLVVVAIIALLVAILLPSLSRAKAQARMVQCQSNMRQLAIAFGTYTFENKGRLPGNCYDWGADWLGYGNNGYSGKTGRQPDDGAIWKYMGKARLAYRCPDDVREGNGSYYSYTANFLLSGAKTELAASAHYPLDNYNTANHNGASVRMRAFEGIPMLIEEDRDYWLIRSPEGGWANTDCITDRHLPVGAKGFGNIGFTDGHVGKVQLPPDQGGTPGNNYFCMNNHCIRTAGGKWVSGKAWNDWATVHPAGPASSVYGYLSVARDAAVFGITH